jgi:uncharacterized protein (TIGR02246 family)
MHNPALGEIYQRLYPEIRRAKPNQDAIAAALQAMQDLATETDSEQSGEDTALEATETTTTAAVCPVCGHPNREGNRFCGKCGLLVEDGSGSVDLPEELPQPPELPASAARSDIPGPAPRSAAAAPGTHHYHHHYHHHYFRSERESAAVPRANPESVREADRLRVAAAAKGEPMSRGEASVRRLTQEWVLACNTRQLEELLELYAPDALVLRSNHPPVRGASSIREFFVAALDAGLGEAEIEPIRVEVAGDMAYEAGRYNALVPATVGKRREERGRYLWVFSRQSNGQWKLTADCWSSDLNLPGAESDLPKTETRTGIESGPPRKGR